MGLLTHGQAAVQVAVYELLQQLAMEVGQAWWRQLPIAPAAAVYVRLQEMCSLQQHI